MYRENKVFEKERSEYQRVVNYGGIYPMGTFLPQEKQKIHQTFVQMAPTPNTVLMFNTLRDNFGYVPFEDSYQNDETIYTLSGTAALEIVQRLYDVNPHITNMTGEFLDTAGLHLPHHTIQLVEMTQDDGTYYYVLTGGKGAIEAKADELFNANKMLTDEVPFQKDDMGLTINLMSLLDLAVSMANDSFQRTWTLRNPLHAQELYAIDSNQLIDLEESTKWIPLKNFENWTHAKRLGIVFRIHPY